MNAGSAGRGRGVLLIAVVVAAGIVVSASIGAAKPPTGDTDAIASFRTQADAYRHVPGVKIVETGYFFVQPGKGTTVDYSWGQKPPAGSKPATATILAQLLEGKYNAYLAKLTAPGVRPVRVLMAGSNVYISTTRCWRRSEASASPLGTGERYVFNDGGAHYLPMKKNGATTSITFTYGWTPGSRAAETTTFGSGKTPPFTVAIAITGKESLNVHKSVTPLAKAPALPVPSPPLRPVPKPLCPKKKQTTP